MKLKNILSYLSVAVIMCFVVSAAVYSGTITKGKLTKSDIALWTGTSSTEWERETSTEYTLTLPYFDYVGVDVLEVYGGNVNANDTTLQLALDAIETTNERLIWMAPTTWDIDDDVTVPSNVTTHVPPGCLLQVAAGKTLTINGPIKAGLQQIFSGAGTIAGNPIVENTIPEWWGAKGDGTTNDQTAIDTALTHWLQRTIEGEFRFLSGKNYLINTAISKTITTDIIGGWSINGYGSKITSGLTTGYLFTFTCNTTDMRSLNIHGLTVVGSGNEDGILYLDGGAASKYFYLASLRDLDFGDFGGTGIYVTHVFESSFNSVASRPKSTNITGYGFHFVHSFGSTSSISLVNCDTYYGLKGLYVADPVGDINVIGGTYSHAQEYGIHLANCFGGAVVNVHVENNWESAANIAAGDAGIYIVGSGSAIGCYGTTTSKQKYVVKHYVNAGETSNIIGGVAGGNTVKYANIDGDTNSSVNIIGDNTYDASAATPCAIMRDGLDHRDGSYIATSGAGEDDLQSYTVAADTMGIFGGLRIIAAGVKVVGGGNKTLKLHWGAASYTFHIAANNTNDWRLEAIIYNENNASVQRISWVGYDGATVLQGYESGAQDTTGDITVKITGECADAGDRIDQYIWLVERL